MDLSQKIIEAADYYNALYYQIYCRYSSSSIHQLGNVGLEGEEWKNQDDNTRNFPTLNFAQYICKIHDIGRNDCNLRKNNHYTYITKPLLQGGWVALSLGCKHQDLTHIKRAHSNFIALSEYMNLLAMHQVFARGEFRNIGISHYGFFPGLYKAITENTMFSEPSPILYVYESKKRLENEIFEDFSD